ncbi:hypothetical protein ACIBM3_15360 [Rhodococcus erythropolis]|uniref:hypothetical protein n=1 Tax=Rhodococcus erythropolis TaxID=1833 RepID=UPI0037B1575F
MQIHDLAGADRMQGTGIRVDGKQIWMDRRHRAGQKRYEIVLAFDHELRGLTDGTFGNTVELEPDGDGSVAIRLGGGHG